jgi:hypothetical protein
MNIDFFLTFITVSDNYDTPDYPSLTWDTLKSRRRQTSQANLLLNKPSQARISTECDITHNSRLHTSNSLYRSSPDLWGGNHNFSERKPSTQTKIQKQNVLKHTCRCTCRSIKCSNLFHFSLENYRVPDNFKLHW